jgi:hypothetical protein
MVLTVYGACEFSQIGSSGEFVDTKAHYYGIFLVIYIVSGTLSHLDESERGVKSPGNPIAFADLQRHPFHCTLMKLKQDLRDKRAADSLRTKCIPDPEVNDVRFVYNDMDHQKPG